MTKPTIPYADPGIDDLFTDQNPTPPTSTGKPTTTGTSPSATADNLDDLVASIGTPGPLHDRKRAEDGLDVLLDSTPRDGGGEPSALDDLFANVFGPEPNGLQDNADDQDPADALDDDPAPQQDVAGDVDEGGPDEPGAGQLAEADVEPDEFTELVRAVKGQVGEVKADVADGDLVELRGTVLETAASLKEQLERYVELLGEPPWWTHKVQVALRHIEDDL